MLTPESRELMASSASTPAETLFGIGELCAEFALSPRAVRFYEDKGLLSPRRVNGARVYTQRDRARIKIILRAKALGSTLEEIKHFLELYGAHGEGRSRQRQWLLARTEAAIAELEGKRAHIEATLAELRLIHDTTKREMNAR